LRRFIGLDIQADELRLVQLHRLKHTLLVENIGLIPIPRDVISEGRLQRPEQVTAHLHEWVESTPLKGTSAAIAMPAYCVISKRIQLFSGLRDIEREAEIAIHLKHYFPGIAEELCFDYVLLESEDTLHDHFLLVAARHEQLSCYVEAVENAGLKVKIVDVDIYALARNITKNETMVLLDIGTITSQFVVIYKNEILFFQQMMNRDLAELKNELKRVLQLCYSTHRFLKIKKIYLTGRADDFRLLASHIQNEFAIHVDFVNPFHNISFLNPKDKEICLHSPSRMAVSCSLAIRGLI
jgi:type IV pilus assembly protein PilM